MMPESPSIGAQTTGRYAIAFEEFVVWTGRRGRAVTKLAKNVDTLDSALVKYLEELHLEGNATSVARAVLFGVMFELGLGKGPTVLPPWRQSRQGLRQDARPVSQQPCPHKAAALVIASLLQDEPLLSMLSGLAIGVQYDLFTRPPGTQDTLKKNVVAPQTKAYQNVGVIDAPSRVPAAAAEATAQADLRAPPPTTPAASPAARPAMSEEFDDTVLAGLQGLGFEFAHEVLLSLQRRALPGQPLFSAGNKLLQQVAAIRSDTPYGQHLLPDDLCHSLKEQMMSAAKSVRRLKALATM